MRAQRRTAPQPRSTGAVSVGQWVRIPVPGEPFPVYMRIGPGAEMAAFIDHESDGSGGLRTVAARRCPPLPLGDHVVVVRLPNGALIESAVTVV